MVAIYFDERVINLCSSFEEIPHDPNLVLYICRNSEELANLAHLFYQSSTIDTLWAVVPDIENPLELFSSKLNRMEAGGGLVLNGNHQLLMIYKRGFWDLPKGKRDKGEEIEQTALREIFEECGLPIEHMKIERAVGVSYHTFMRDGELNFKETKWFIISYNGNNGLIKPQALENIEKVEWVDPHNVSEYFGMSYRSLQSFMGELKEIFELSL
ncbi:MAG: NUDIX domain-containing protein [Bacteroidales bacterium]